MADAYNDRIQIIGPYGSAIKKWGGPFASNIKGSANGWFNTATAVAVGPKGNIFVADFYNNRIQKFTSDGRFLVAFGGNGNESGKLKFPTDMALDSTGNVYVVDFGNNRIVKFKKIVFEGE